MTAAVAEGIGTARARFGRYAGALAARHPSLTAVAAAHPAEHHAGSHPAEVEPHSAAAQQLELLEAFTQGAYSAPDFAHDWWEARRVSQANGERLRGPLADLFGRVFMLLEDYSVDPELAEPGDLSDTDLRTAVTAAWNTFGQFSAERSGHVSPRGED
ncbi:hypothetical protein [Streptomyces sp. NPDC006193]|uniref:hypothetical protein n=1 Tax=Streptomyces sp. NPDC006193 TaxID=3155717 RepID=UPI0033AB0199